MMLVVGVVGPEYAVVIQDTRCIIVGPAHLTLQGVPLPTTMTYDTDTDGNLVLGKGESLTVDGYHPSLSKVRLSALGDEAFAHAGTRPAAEFLGLNSSDRGIGADEQITEHLGNFSRFDQFLTCPPGEYDSYGALHVSRAEKRFTVSSFDSSICHFKRECRRSRKEELLSPERSTRVERRQLSGATLRTKINKSLGTEGQNLAAQQPAEYISKVTNSAPASLALRTLDLIITGGQLQRKWVVNFGDHGQVTSSPRD